MVCGTQQMSCTTVIGAHVILGMVSKSPSDRQDDANFELSEPLMHVCRTVLRDIVCVFASLLPPQYPICSQRQPVELGQRQISDTSRVSTIT